MPRNNASIEQMPERGDSAAAICGRKTIIYCSRRE